MDQVAVSYAARSSLPAGRSAELRNACLVVCANLSAPPPPSGSFLSFYLFF